jgi:hypothetical protein
MIPDNRDRIEELLKPFGWVLKPLGCFVFCSAGWLISSLLSDESIGMAYVWAGIGLILFSAQLERSWLNRLAFPPLTTLVFTLNLRWISGGFILLLSDNQAPHEVFVDHITAALPLTLIPSACLVCLGWAINKLFIQDHLVSEKKWNTNDSQFRSIILWLTVLTGIIAIGYIVVGALGGTLDRGENYLRWAGRFWRPDTVLSALIRLRDLFYVCLPLAIWQNRKSKRIVLLLSLPTVAAMLISLSLGGRGLIIYPALLLLGGAWMAGMKPKVAKILCIVAVISILVFSVGLEGIRTTNEFKNSSTFDLQQRFSGTKKAVEKIGNELGSNLTYLGVSLYTHSDPYLFTPPASEQEPVGTKRLGNLIYLWVPRVFLTERPEVNDGHLIANEIRNRPNKGLVDGRFTSFWNVSFGADLYWRFRWAGLIIGSIIFGILYAYVSRLWYRYAGLNGNVYAVLAALFPATFLQGPPLRSVSETAWNWLYEFPKYFIVLLVVGLIIKTLIKRQKQLLS